MVTFKYRYVDNPLMKDVPNAEDFPCDVIHGFWNNQKWVIEISYDIEEEKVDTSIQHLNDIPHKEFISQHKHRLPTYNEIKKEYKTYLSVCGTVNIRTLALEELLKLKLKDYEW